jgi:aminopeptidase N
MIVVYHGRYFAVPYPLPKMDMIAIPDFSAGAMENYGLVTYRETALLFDERHSAAANKQRVGFSGVLLFQLFALSWEYDSLSSLGILR